MMYEAVIVPRINEWLAVDHQRKQQDMQKLVRK